MRKPFEPLRGIDQKIRIGHWDGDTAFAQAIELKEANTAIASDKVVYDELTKLFKGLSNLHKSTLNLADELVIERDLLTKKFKIAVDALRRVPGKATTIASEALVEIGALK